MQNILKYANLVRGYLNLLIYYILAFTSQHQFIESRILTKTRYESESQFKKKSNRLNFYHLI